MDSPPPSAPTPPSPSPPRPSLHHNSTPTLLQPLPLLLPAPSPRRRSKRRPAIVDEIVEARPNELSPQPTRKGKSRAAAAASRNVRRTRRKPVESADGPCDDDDDASTRKRKRGRQKVIASGEKPRPVPLVPSSNPSLSEIPHGGLDGSWEQVLEVIMWKNAAKSTLWFGLGSMFFLSSCFSRESSFSTISAMSNMGLLVLGAAFVKNTVTQRQRSDLSRNLQLTEDNILHAARVILPVVNAALTRIQDIFSGDPLRTLKVAPILLLGAKYGHLITLWRFLVTGFFVSFTVPKLYLCYSQQINTVAKNAINWIQEAWKSCNHKRLVAASAATVFWNFFSLRTRIFAAFIFVVMLRYRHQQHVGEEKSEKESKEEGKQKDVLVAEQKPHMMQLD